MKPNQKKFLKDLLTLCKQHKVNFHSSQLEFHPDTTMYDLYIHGGWPLRPGEVELQLSEVVDNPVKLTIKSEE